VDALVGNAAQTGVQAVQRRAGGKSSALPRLGLARLGAALARLSGWLGTGRPAASLPA